MKLSGTLLERCVFFGKPIAVHKISSLIILNYDCRKYGDIRRKW